MASIYSKLLPTSADNSLNLYQNNILPPRQVLPQPQERCLPTANMPLDYWDYQLATYNLNCIEESNRLFNCRCGLQSAAFWLLQKRNADPVMGISF